MPGFRQGSPIGAVLEASTSKPLCAAPAVLLLCLAFGACAVSDPGTSTKDWDSFRDWIRVGQADWRMSRYGVDAGPEDTLAYLVSPERYGDFRLRLEFWVDDETNSGIFVRCIDPEQINPDTCYEINIWDNHPDQLSRTGSIVKLAPPIARVDTIGRWNTCEIEAAGNSIVATFNGKITARLQSDRARAGYIALQYAGKNQLRLRNLRIDSEWSEQ